MEIGEGNGLQGSMSILAVLFFSALAVAQSPSRVSVMVDLSYLKLQAPIGILSYDEAVVFPNQTKLRNVQLRIEDEIYFPAIRISAYLDEISGTAICRRFGFGRGFLGQSMGASRVNVFSINYGGFIYIQPASQAPMESYATADVICQP